MGEADITLPVVPSIFAAIRMGIITRYSIFLPVDVILRLYVCAGASPDTRSRCDEKARGSEIESEGRLVPAMGKK